MRLVVTGGGTGGHIYPALAVALRFAVDPAHSVVFMGSAAGPEGRAASAACLEFKGYSLGGVHGKHPLAAAAAMWRFAVATAACLAAFRKERPDCVVGTGGYASAPACCAAAALRLPLVLIEPNLEPGIVVRALSSRASAVAVAFEETGSRLRKGARVEVIGVPVRREIEEVGGRERRLEARREAAYEFGTTPDLPTVLVFGGSQGAGALNDATWEMVSGGSVPGGVQVLHLTGPAGHGKAARARAQECAAASGAAYVAVPYTERMELAYAAADLAVCRSGAGTLAELRAAGLPAVLVPYPYATGGHQQANARQLAADGGAVVIEQRGGSAEEALAGALRLVADREELRSMRGRASARGPARGTEGVVALVEELT